MLPLTFLLRGGVPSPDPSPGVPDHCLARCEKRGGLPVQHIVNHQNIGFPCPRRRDGFAT
eukprot:2971311-Pyramimonas_sp.AAC.1